MFKEFVDTVIFIRLATLLNADLIAVFNLFRGIYDGGLILH
jgi:hypothetical protein